MIGPQSGFEAERVHRAKNHDWLPPGRLDEPAMSPGWSRGIGNDNSDYHHRFETLNFFFDFPCRSQSRKAFHNPWRLNIIASFAALHRPIIQCKFLTTRIYNITVTSYT